MIYRLICLLQAVSSPHCQSVWMSDLDGLLAMSTFLRINILETKEESGLVPIGSL